MTFYRSFKVGSAITLVTAAPAFADLTAEQVVADQLRQMQLYGLTAEVSSQSRSGDTLIVEEITASADTPDGSFEVTVGGANFREMGDGTVEVTYPDAIPISVSGAAEDGEEFEMVMSLTQTNTTMIVSGIPEEITYDFTSDTFVLEDLRFVAPQEAADLDMDFSFQIGGIAGVMSWIGGGTIRDYTADFSFETMTGTFSGTPEEDQGEFNLEFAAENVAADYSGRSGPQDLMSSFAQTIEAGNTTTGTARHGPLTYTLSGNSPDGSFDVAAAVASGEFDFNMDEGGLDYGTVSQDMTISVGGSVIPLPPLTFKMAESAFRFAMPVVPSEEEQDFGFRMNLAGLEIDDMLWGLIDPTGQIERDPATLVIDLDGQATMKEDIFDPAFAEQMTGAPGEFNALNVNQILLSLAGAELTGDGAFTFSNAGPIPMPAGTLNMMLSGGNGLLDKLVNMGLVPEEQAMGARMMLGMFARPGTGPDTLVSTIEMKEDGSVLANGQRIR
ncbi:MAG: DUF2125 domain-containing protein [Pseudomonadota bacterium]